MKGLLLVAHGSRSGSSNDAVRVFTTQLAKFASEYQMVDCAFLELADPDIPTGLRNMIRNGVREISVLPYFLSAGRHVVEDIPAELEKVTGSYPEIKIQLAPYLGSSPSISAVLLQQARSIS